MLFVIEINFSNLNTITTQQQKGEKMRLAPTAVWVSDGGGGYSHRNAIRGRAAQMGRFLTKNP